MSGVWLPRIHRADHDADQERARLSPYLTVVDLEPALTREEALTRSALAQCASCNFVNFLGGLKDAQDYEGLVALRALFGSLSPLTEAAARTPASLVHAARRIGVKRVFELVYPGRTPSAGLPHVHVLRDGSELHAPGPEDWVLVEPDRNGQEVLRARVERAQRAGAQRVLVGYVEHARAMDNFVDFVESTGSHEHVPERLASLAGIGLGQVGFAMAFPPCASLTWPSNRKLEALRAQLDLHFRRVEADSSYMCPENVSGYSLSSDMSTLTQAFPAPVRAFRLDALLLLA